MLLPSLRVVGLLADLVLAPTPASAQPEPQAIRVFRATDFGLIGDGVTDDGPAIDRVLRAVRQADGPAMIRFPADRTIRVKTAPDRYVFRFQKAAGVVVDGGGCTFVLDPYLRFLSLTESRRTEIRRLNVDFEPLPFADGIVIAADAATRRLTVRLLPGVAMPPAGGPTGEDGEQAFFAMLHYDGPYGTLTEHCWVNWVAPGPEPGCISVTAARSFAAYDRIEPGRWRISVPVPGLAHRFGPGACFTVHDNDGVTMEDVELWSAPWFGFSVARNSGEVIFRRVNVRPKPGSGRLMSLWRDGFHVKGNRARLLWADCELTGMNDDALNISTHSSSVTRVDSSTEIEVRQRFPLLPIPWREGAALTAVDETAARLLGTAHLTAAQAGPEPEPIEGQRAAPPYRLTLDQPIEGLTVGTMVWDPDQCNPDTTLRACRINQSCRLQSPVRLQRCEVNALLWFYCEPVEGGFPHHFSVSDCVLKRGRGNPTLVLAVSGAPQADLGPEAAQAPRAIHDVQITGNEIRGAVSIQGAERVRVTGNRFLEPGAPLTVAGNTDLVWALNTGPSGEAREGPQLPAQGIRGHDPQSDTTGLGIMPGLLRAR